MRTIILFGLILASQSVLLSQELPQKRPVLLTELSAGGAFQLNRAETGPLSQHLFIHAGSTLAFRPVRFYLFHHKHWGFSIQFEYFQKSNRWRQLFENQVETRYVQGSDNLLTSYNYGNQAVKYGARTATIGPAYRLEKGKNMVIVGLNGGMMRYKNMSVGASVKTSNSHDLRTIEAVSQSPSNRFDVYFCANMGGSWGRFLTRELQSGFMLSANISMMHPSRTYHITETWQTTGQKTIRTIRNPIWMTQLQIGFFTYRLD